MAFISFAKEELPTTEGNKSDSQKIVPIGAYKAKILEGKNITNTFNPEGIYKITWTTTGAPIDHQISKNFKLWDADARTRVKAHSELIDLLRLLNVNIFFTDTKIEFDDDALVDKEIGLKINHGKDSQGKTYAYIASFFLIMDNETGNKIIEDTIGF